MEKKTIRFLIASICGIFAACVMILGMMTRYMQKENEETMKQVCRLYLSEMSNQIEGHFSSVTGLRFDMEEAILKRYPPENVAEYGQDMVDELTFAAKIRNYEFVGLYSPEGELEDVYGEPIELVNPDPFLQSLKSGEQKLVSGIGKNTEKRYILFGMDASYPMRSGGRSLALVVGLPLSYINESMSLNLDDTLIYSHIINKEGIFILRNDNNNARNYFDWILSECSFEGQTAEQVVNDFKAAIANGEDFSIIVTVDGQRRNIYCEPLQDTEWILVTVMLYGDLDEAVYDLGRLHMQAAVFAGLTILLVLGGVFAVYFKMSLQQIRSLREARQEAVHANEAKSIFLSNMSHDIRTPMNAIIGMTSIATTNQDKPDVVQECLRKITLSSRHLLGLINDVLDMSKIESGKLSMSIKEMSLRGIFENIVNIANPQIREKKQVFDIFIQDIQTEYVYCDDVRLNQVLINLLSNAIKFTPPEGHIYITLQQEDSPKGANYVRNHIRVKDTGIGMAPDFIETIFEPFSREKKDSVHHTEGTGLGMAITKHIIDELHGTIRVESELGKGTEFHVTLDLERAMVKEADMVLPDWKLLLVDDDEQLIESAMKDLKEMGVRFESAHSAETALELVQKGHEEQNDYQVILLDWQMPGMDGLELARRMRELIGNEIPILLTSAYDWSDIEDQARAAGINGFIAKPLFKSTLYYGLMNCMNETAGEQETEEQEEQAIKDIRLLVAEDYDMNWEIIETLLPDNGYQVERAENGQICVEMFEAAKTGYYSAILMDIRMPVMDGYEATKRIRESGHADADLPIIAMTADAFSDDVRRCLDCGMNAHVAKPIDMRELLNLLKKFL